MSYQIENVSHGTVHATLDNMLLVDYSRHESDNIYTLGMNETNVNLIDSSTVGVWKIKKLKGKEFKYKYPFDTFENLRLKAISKFGVF